MTSSVLTKEELVAVVKKHPGILFARGVAIAGEKPEGENENVWRIMDATRVLEMANEEEEVARLFIPTTGNKDEVIGTQMTGNWKGREVPTIVAFKRRDWGEEGEKRERGLVDEEERRRGEGEEGGRKKMRREGGLRLGKRGGENGMYDAKKKRGGENGKHDAKEEGKDACWGNP